MHQSTLHRMKTFADTVRERFAGRTCRILEVGSMQVENDASYRPLFIFPGAEYIGLDVASGPNVDVVPQDPYDWSELADTSFDVVISGQALEHIEFPWLTFEQIARKLKSGGLACLIAPSRGPEHRFPVDCYRYYPDGMRSLARWSGLTVLEAGYLNGDCRFHDGSHQWGDCHCILTKSDGNGQQGVAGAGSEGRPSSESHRGTASLCPGHPDVTNVRKHATSPLDLPPAADYFDFVRDDVLEAIRQQGLQAQRVIELGCASGGTGRRLKQLLDADYYVGIEANRAAAEQARVCLDAVYVADLQTQTAADLGLEPGSFDLLLALDVLEHLYNPWDVLADFARVLRAGGYAVLSIPNVQNISLLQQLAAGRWTYQNAGLLDATHIRFFTLHEAQNLISGAGLSLTHVTGKLLPEPDMAKIDDAGNTVNVGRLSLSDLTRNDVIALFTYQYLLIAQNRC